MPESEEIDVGQLTVEMLDTVVNILDDYVAFPSPEARDAVALWVLHAHVYRSFESTPRLALNSTEPHSGKTRVLEVLERLAPNAVYGLDMTPAVLWRLLENHRATLLIDECDTVFGKAGSGSAYRQLRAIINAGHRRDAAVPRTVGADDVRMFHVFGPIAMAGLGRLPETIADRSIPIRMRRRRKDQAVQPLTHHSAPRLRAVQEDLAVWAELAAERLSKWVPDLPVEDRQADVWEAPISIAELAGDEWAQRARTACLALTEDGDGQQESIGIALLRAMREVFGGEPSLFTEDVLARLAKLDGEWSVLSSARQLSNILRDYDVRPTTVRHGDQVAKGYKAEELKDAWARYL